MPTIVAKRSASCSVCSGGIRKGEYAEFTRAQGLVHPECALSASEAVRRNGKAAPCGQCGRHLQKGEGQLHLEEHERADGSWSRRWRVTCLSTCSGAGQ